MPICVDISDLDATIAKQSNTPLFRSELTQMTYAQVYRATDTTGRIVALKKFRSSTRSAAGESENEIRRLRNCKHPNINMYYGSYHPALCIQTKRACQSFSMLHKVSLTTNCENVYSRYTHNGLTCLRMTPVSQSNTCVYSSRAGAIWWENTLWLVLG